jgi:hypothetical protein
VFSQLKNSPDHQHSSEYDPEEGVYMSLSKWFITWLIKTEDFFEAAVKIFYWNYLYECILVKASTGIIVMNIL